MVAGERLVIPGEQDVYRHEAEVEDDASDGDERVEHEGDAAANRVDGQRESGEADDQPYHHGPTTERLEASPALTCCFERFL